MSAIRVLEMSRDSSDNKRHVLWTAKSDQMANAASWFATLTSLKEACDP